MKVWLALIALFACQSIHCQWNIESSLGLLNDADFNSQSRAIFAPAGDIPRVDKEYAFNFSTLLERHTKIGISPYLALQFTDRKLDLNYSTGTATSFHLNALEAPIGLRFRKRITENSFLRFNIGAGINYIVSPDSKSMQKITDPENGNTYYFQVAKRSNVSSFAQSGLAFEARVSSYGIFSAALNFQYQITSMFSYKYRTVVNPAIRNNEFVGQSGGLKTHYISLSIGYAWQFVKKIRQTENSQR